MLPITYETSEVAIDPKMSSCRDVDLIPSVAYVGHYNQYLCYRNAFYPAIRCSNRTLTAGQGGFQTPSCDAPATGWLWEPATGFPCLSPSERE